MNNKMFRSILSFFVLIMVIACNLPTEVPESGSTSSFAEVYIAKPGGNFHKWGEIEIKTGRTAEGSTEFVANMTISDPDKDQLTIAYILVCDRQASPQTGYFLSGQTKITCLGDEFQLYINNSLVMEAKKVDGIIINLPESPSIVIGSEIP